MRLKKQKRHRRAVRFYTVCFGFRQPFKVLCDGTFVHHLIANSITPADTALSNILGGPVKLFTTRCVLAELKRLGKSHYESFQAAQKLIIARCDHEKCKRADVCIMEIIGESNPEHFFVTTQDIDLRKTFHTVPGVPLIFGLRNALFLEPPSAVQHQFAKAFEEKSLHMTELEHKLLKKRTKKMLEDEETGVDGSEGSEDDNVEMKPEKHTARKGMDVKDRPQFKRKKAKGPNPLSCKKKKNHKNANSLPGKENKTGDCPARSRGRKRKRSRKGKKVVETDN